MAITNRELIMQEAIMKGIPYNGDNLKTFNEWKNNGYTVKKGEKACLSVPLWKKIYYTDKQTEETRERFVMTKPVHLFGDWQVKPLPDSRQDQSENNLVYT